MKSKQPLKALFFDVFGTCVDWRGTVTRELHRACQEALGQDGLVLQGENIVSARRMSLPDWGAFAQRWRDTYYDFTSKFAAGEVEHWKTVDEHHLEAFKSLLREHDLDRLWSEAKVQELSLVWHRLDAWPDAVAGMTKLNEQFLTCTLSNGNLQLLHDLKVYSGIPFQQLFSAEMFQSYKPSPAVYLGAAQKLGLKPSQCAMVATHLGDVEAAKALGFAALYVWRPQEDRATAEQIERARTDGRVDLWIEEGQEGFLTLAEKLLLAI